MQRSLLFKHRSSPETTSAASRVRWRICGLLFVISVLTFLNRINISVAARDIQLDLALNNRQLGYIMSVYAFGYALLQIPSGLLGDRWGPRKLLTFGMLWWSAFTGLTAVAGWLAGSVGLSVMAGLLFMRFMVGLGEATTLPNSSKIVACWMAPLERGIGNSMFLAGGGVGGAISPLLVVWMISKVGWHWSFAICALPGIPLALIWYWYSRDRPEQHPQVNAAELAIIHPFVSSADCQIDRVPTTELSWAGDLNIWMLVISYGFQGYVVYIFYTWFYLYIVTVRGFALLRAGYWSSIPFISVALMTPLGGFVSDKLSVVLGKGWSRRATVLLGTCSSGVLLLAGARIHHAPTAIVLLGLAAGCLAFAVVSWWASVNDISAAKSATLSGVMNTAGNIGGMISPILTPWIAENFGWVRALDFAAGVVFCAGALWLFIKPSASPSVRLT